MNEKTFDCAGFSTLKGVIKPRVANGLLKRYKTLERYGHKDIKLIMLPEPMTRRDAVNYVLEHSDRVYELADQHIEQAIAERDAAKLNRQSTRKQKEEKPMHSGSADDEMQAAFSVVDTDDDDELATVYVKSPGAKIVPDRRVDDRRG